MVRSKKVLARIERFEVPVMTQDGRISFINKGTSKVYEYLFDETQARALREARELAERSGMALEVTDLTRQSPLGRVAKFLFTRNSPLWAAPNLVVEPRLVSTTAVTAVAQEKCDWISSPVARL